MVSAAIAEIACVVFAPGFYNSLTNVPFSMTTTNKVRGMRSSGVQQSGIKERRNNRRDSELTRKGPSRGDTTLFPKLALRWLQREPMSAFRRATEARESCLSELSVCLVS